MKTKIEQIIEDIKKLKEEFNIDVDKIDFTKILIECNNSKDKMAENLEKIISIYSQPLAIPNMCSEPEETKELLEEQLEYYKSQTLLIESKLEKHRN